MRTVKVTLIQDRDNSDLFYVAKFSNSAELSVGDPVSRQTLEGWIDRTKFPRVEFTVAGLAPEAEDAEGGNNNERINALEID